MMKALVLALSLPLVACMVGDTGNVSPGGGGGGGGGGGSGSGSGSGSGGAGEISTDTTWSGTMTISANVTVDPAVTLTIAAGATIDIATGVEITVNGTLLSNGTAASPVIIEPADGAAHFGAGETGVIVGDGTNVATLTYTFTKQVGAGILVNGGSTATITDSHFAQSEGDFLVTSTGATPAVVVAKYIQIGLDTGDTTHCDTHFGGGTLTMVHSVITGSSYGSMFYGGTGAKFKSNNWLTNTTEVDATPGAVSGDFTGSYFQNTPPAAMSGITLDTPVNTTTPNPACPADTSLDMTCAGVHGNAI
ncbi:MAG TPA: hypothetical protein VGF94_09970 [Kofleriaceae bacterium]